MSKSKSEILSTMKLRRGASGARALRQIEVAAQTYFQDYYSKESNYRGKIELIQRTSGKLALKIERKRHVVRGRVTREAMLAYVLTLLLIYERTTGKRIGRRYDAYAGKETPHPFLVACIHLVGRRYPPKIVQRVLGELHAKPSL